MSKFSFTHIRKDSGISEIENIENITVEELTEVLNYDDIDCRSCLIPLEQQFRKNFNYCKLELNRLSNYLLQLGFIRQTTNPSPHSPLNQTDFPKSLRNYDESLNYFYPIFYKYYDKKIIEIEYSFSAEVTDKVEEISKQRFIIKDVSNTTALSWLTTGSVIIFNSYKIPKDLLLIDQLINNHLN